VASNQRLRKARRRVAKLMDSIERWKHQPDRAGIFRAQLRELLPDLGRWEYLRHRVREAKQVRRRGRMEVSGEM